MSDQRTREPSLAEVCPAFRAKMAEHGRMVAKDQRKAERLFLEAQQIAREFRNAERTKP